MRKLLSAALLSLGLMAGPALAADAPAGPPPPSGRLGAMAKTPSGMMFIDLDHIVRSDSQVSFSILLALKEPISNAAGPITMIVADVVVDCSAHTIANPMGRAYTAEGALVNAQTSDRVYKTADEAINVETERLVCDSATPPIKADAIVVGYPAAAALSAKVMQ